MRLLLVEDDHMIGETVVDVLRAGRFDRRVQARKRADVNHRHRRSSRLLNYMVANRDIKASFRRP